MKKVILISIALLLLSQISFAQGKTDKSEIDKSKPAIIPFTVGKDHRIHIKGKVNKSEEIDFVFDTGANGNVITSSLVNKKVLMELDGSAMNSGSDGLSLIKTSSSNLLEIGELKWDKTMFISINYQNPPFEGVIGWTAFEDKVIEINYDKKALIISDSTGKIGEGYSKYKMKMLRGLPYIEGTIFANGIGKTGWFEFDTGSDWSLSLSQKFAGENSLNDKMRKIATSFSQGSAGVKYEASVVMSSKIKLGDFEMYQIPISINKTDPKGVVHNDILGNLLLKRFNAIIDFKNKFIYLKPNNLMHTPYVNKLIK